MITQDLYKNLNRKVKIWKIERNIQRTKKDCYVKLFIRNVHKSIKYFLTKRESQVSFIGYPGSINWTEEFSPIKATKGCSPSLTGGSTIAISTIASNSFKRKRKRWDIGSYSINTTSPISNLNPFWRLFYFFNTWEKVHPSEFIA